MNLSIIPSEDDIPELSMNVTDTQYNPLEDAKIIMTSVPILFCCVLRFCHVRAIKQSIREKKSNLKEELLKEDTTEECSICLEAYKRDETIIILDCSHKFHKRCIHLWFQKESNCPNCRLTV
jgi:hypothetical protein